MWSGKSLAKTAIKKFFREIIKPISNPANSDIDLISDIISKKSLLLNFA